MIPEEQHEAREQKVSMAPQQNQILSQAQQLQKSVVALPAQDKVGIGDKGLAGAHE